MVYRGPGYSEVRLQGNAQRVHLFLSKLGGAAMNLVLYRTLCAVSVLIVLYATLHLILAGRPRGSPNHLLQITVSAAFFLGAAHVAGKQRELDWRDRPDKLRKLRLAERLVLVAAVVLFVAFWAFLYDCMST
jgi:hypothetical protein